MTPGDAQSQDSGWCQNRCRPEGPPDGPIEDEAGQDSQRRWLRDSACRHAAPRVELGLAGPMTATVAGPELLDFINWTLLPQLGQYPHGAITGWGEILVPPPSRATSRSSFR